MPEVIDAIITFYDDWQETGPGADGLPLYEEKLMICLAKPPLTERRREADDYDKVQFREAYEEYLRQRKGRDLGAIKGYPLCMWPVVGPAELKMLLVRDVVTVEQLAAFATSRDTPPPILELAKRAKKLIELQGKTGKYEAIIHELASERDALDAELKEARGTIAAQNSMIGMLQAPRHQVA
jgi:hypothetical protein